MAGRSVTPVDPDCPEVARFTENLWSDPMRINFGAFIAI